MPISDREKKSRAPQYVRKYFPKATPDEIKRIAELAVLGFSNNLSPYPHEQNHPGTASGTGVNFEQYVVYSGGSVLGVDTEVLSQEVISNIIYKCTSI